ncbi:hydrogenase maturation protease [Ilumatobacter sp.]|uniref:hydrogenase maturation protease n=1 Tax=Ilumatobacter sp. TaxID=1967498 RepID=UPI003AF50BAF
MISPPTVVIGVGNRDRGDDAAGPAVCDRIAALAGGLRTVVLESSTIDLVNHWSDDDLVAIVDAARPDGHPGRIVEHDGLVERLVVPGTASTHSIDVAGGIELARAMGRLPAALTIISIEGGSFAFGAPLGTEVRRSVDEVASRLSRREVSRAAGT